MSNPAPSPVLRAIERLRHLSAIALWFATLLGRILPGAGKRAEQAADLEDQFISLWIAFNAIYGRLESDGSAADHSTWQEFLAQVARLDTEGLFTDLMHRNRVSVLRLINNKYLFRPFWAGLAAGEKEQRQAEHALQQAGQYAVVNLGNHMVAGPLQELFERLYVLRAQVFHGAATRGSKLNRQVMRMGTQVLAQIVPAMIQVMLQAGLKVDWGTVCFPPVEA